MDYARQAWLSREEREVCHPTESIKQNAGPANSKLKTQLQQSNAHKTRCGGAESARPRADLRSSRAIHGCARARKTRRRRGCGRTVVPRAARSTTLCSAEARRRPEIPTRTRCRGAIHRASGAPVANRALPCARSIPQACHITDRASRAGCRGRRDAARDAVITRGARPDARRCGGPRRVRVAACGALCSVRRRRAYRAVVPRITQAAARRGRGARRAPIRPGWTRHWCGSHGGAVEPHCARRACRRCAARCTVVPRDAAAGTAAV